MLARLTILVVITFTLAAAVLSVAPHSGVSKSDATTSTPPPFGIYSGYACYFSDCGLAAVGREVVAKIGDLQCGIAATSRSEQDGVTASRYEIEIPANYVVPGCGQTGAIIRFYIDGEPVEQTAQWSAGHLTNNIWAGPDVAVFSGLLVCVGDPCFDCSGQSCRTPAIAGFVGGVVCGQTSGIASGFPDTGGYRLLVIKAAQASMGCGSHQVQVMVTVNGRPARAFASWTPGFRDHSVFVDYSLEGMIWGDLNCSENIDASDALGVLRYEALLPQIGAPCYQQQPLRLDPYGVTKSWFDLDCSDEIDLMDAISLLFFGSGDSVDQPAQCPPLGSRVEPLPG